MNRWKPILAAALIFASGMVTAVFAYRLSPKSWRPPTEGSLSPWFIDSRFDVLRKMQRELNLSTDQSTRIDAIIQEGRSRTKEIWDACQPQFREEMKLVRERIQAELSPEQRTKFDELVKRSRERKGQKAAGEKTNASAPATPPSR